MFGAGLHEDRAPFRDPHGLALDLEHTITFEHHIDLVVRVRLLPIFRLRGHKHVDAELEARRLMDNLVAAGGGYETILDLRDAEGVHGDRPY